MADGDGFINDDRYFRKVEEKQARLHERLKAEGPVPNQGMAMACRTPEELSQFWTKFSRQAQGKFDNRHEKGWVRLVRNYQKFAEKVQTFMTHSRLLLDACQQLSPPFSAAAMATLALLFMTASYKSQIEGTIASVLEDIQARLPSLEIFTQCYAVDREHGRSLRRKILLAHTAIVDLSVDIVTYYIQPGYRRWTTAAFRPTKFEDARLQVNERFNAVRQQCDERLHLNISEVKTVNLDLQQKLDRMQQDQGNTGLLQLHKLLGIATWSPAQQAEELNRYRLSMQDEEFYEEAYMRMTGDHIEKFWREDAFAEWSQNERPFLLVLTGTNNTNIAEMKRHCWLSPIAVNMIDRHQSEGSTLTYYIFHEQHGTSIGRALPIIVAQLLNFKRAELGEHQMALASYAERLSQLADGSDAEKAVPELRRLLRETVRMFNPRESISIVIDRLDICEESERGDLLRLMVDLSNEARCNVKILVVTQWVPDWEPNYKELKRYSRFPATVQHASRVQGVRGFTY